MIEKRKYLIIFFLILMHANLFSQITYSQGFFETDKDFSNRVMTDYRPIIEYIAECYVGHYDMSNKLGYIFRFRPTKIKVSGDLQVWGWPDIIVKFYSRETKTFIYTSRIETTLSNFLFGLKNYDPVVILPVTEIKEELWQKIYNEEIVIEFYSKSSIIGRFKLDNIATLTDRMENGTKYFYPVKF